MAAGMIRLVPTPAPPPDARAAYRPDDYTLVVAGGADVPAGAFRASVDALTLFFDPGDQVLAGLEAFTNPERWEVEALPEPAPDRDAALRCTSPFDVHGIGEGAPGPLRYTRSPDGRTLRIGVGDGPVHQRVRCLAPLVCGLAADGSLAEIWITGLGA